MKFFRKKIIIWKILSISLGLKFFEIKIFLFISPVIEKKTVPSLPCDITMLCCLFHIMVLSANNLNGMFGRALSAWMMARERSWQTLLLFHLYYSFLLLNNVSLLFLTFFYLNFFLCFVYLLNEWMDKIYWFINEFSHFLMQKLFTYLYFSFFISLLAKKKFDLFYKLLFYIKNKTLYNSLNTIE